MSSRGELVLNVWEAAQLASAGEVVITRPVEAPPGLGEQVRVDWSRAVRAGVCRDGAPYLRVRIVIDGRAEGRLRLDCPYMGADVLAAYGVRAHVRSAQIEGWKPDADGRWNWSLRVVADPVAMEVEDGG